MKISVGDDGWMDGWLDGWMNDVISDIATFSFVYYTRHIKKVFSFIFTSFLLLLFLALNSNFKLLIFL